MSNEHATFKCTVDEKTVDCGSGTEGEFTTDALPDGRHNFKLDLVDKVGNRGEPVTASWETGIGIEIFTRIFLLVVDA